MVCIGKKGYEYFVKRYKKLNLISDHVELFPNLEFDTTAKISQMIMDKFDAKEIDAVDVAYGEFKNAAVQYYRAEQFLPIERIEPDATATGEKQMNADFIFEPSEKELLAHMVPSILRTQFHKFLLDTHASEHGARMTAMDKATENADDLLKELKINYNKARQEAITNEISEIVGGAAALEGS